MKAMKNYSLRLTLAGLMSTISAHAVLLYDGFGGYTVGNPLIGAVNSGNGNTWTGIGSGTDQAMVEGSTLSYLTAPRTSGRVVLPPNFISPGATAPQAAALGFTGGSGDVYYSFLIRLQDISGLDPAFQLLTRLTFNTNTFGPAVFLRPTPGTNTYDLGIHKRANGPEVVTDAAVSGLVTGTRHLVVVKYEAQPGEGNDVMKIWLNPTGLGYADPAPSFTATNGNDTAVVWNGFELHPPANLAGADQNYFDELRVGRSWAQVAGELAMHEDYDYNVGVNLIGQTNTDTFTVWTEVGSGTAHSTVASNSLSYPPLRSAANRVQLASFSGSTKDGALPFAGAGTEVYASFLMRLDTLGASMSTSFQTLFRLASGGTGGLGVMVRKNAGDATKFDLGIHKRANTGSAVTDATLQTIATNTPHLIVVRYLVDTNDNDTMQIWLDPSPGSLGGSAPAATFSSTNGTDTTVSWGTAELYPPNQVSGYFDEVRVGLTWASVTPASTTTTVASSQNPSTEGSPVTFTATVASGGSNAVAGFVRFKANGYALADPVALDTNGLAQLTVSNLPVGTNVIRAEFLGADGQHTSAAGLAGDQIVNPVPTTSTITGVSVSGGTVTLNCQGAEGVSYDVERATEVTFTTGLTTLLTTNAPTGGAFTATDNSPPAPKAFYRLKQNP